MVRPSNLVMTKRCFLLSVLVVAVVLLATEHGASAATIESNLRRCATEDEASSVTDFFPEKATTEHSQTWDVTYHETYKILMNKAVNQSYLLYQCGTDPPKDLIESGDFAAVTEVPLPDGVALTSTVQIPMFELLGLRGEIKTYLGDDQYISSVCLKEMIDTGITEVYNPGSTLDEAGDTNGVGEYTSLASWAESNPSRIVIDNEFMATGRNTSNTIIENGYLEGPAKAIFEWIKFYATLYNLEAFATSIADETAARWDCTTDNVATTMASTGAPNPVAVWAYYSTYPGYEGWNVGTCDPKFNHYCEYAQHCSVDLLHSDERMTHEQFEEFAADVDVFFYSSSDWNSVYAENREMLDGFKSVRNRQVYDHEGSGPGTWWEQRMAEYDVVLEDFCAVVNMTTDIAPHTPLWFRNVFTEPVGQLPPYCEDRDAPLESRATECTPLDGGQLPSGTTAGGDDADVAAQGTSGAPAFTPAPYSMGGFRKVLYLGAVFLVGLLGVKWS